MFEGVHDKLPDIMGYLNRLGINEILEPTRENLDKLVYAHLTHIPYENLEYCIEKSCPDLTIGGLYNKLVLKKRGGYCFVEWSEKIPFALPDEYYRLEIRKHADDDNARTITITKEHI